MEYRLTDEIHMRCKGLKKEAGVEARTELKGDEYSSVADSLNVANKGVTKATTVVKPKTQKEKI
eukprot:5313082-Pyramimonas_sp.AAC.1